MLTSHVIYLETLVTWDTTVGLTWEPRACWEESHHSGMRESGVGLNPEAEAEFLSPVA